MKQQEHQARAAPEDSAGRGARDTGRGPALVEILSFDGCPNHDAAVALVERVSSELGLDPEIHLVNVPDQEAAEQLRFLGSPTVRVNGRDVEPDAGERDDFVFACRVYRSEHGLSGQPDEAWMRDALAGAVK